MPVKPNKTQVTALSVEDYLRSIEDTTKQTDCRAILSMMSEVSGKPAVMWGTAIVGFDQYHYKYESGREGDAPLLGFSARKQNISLYITSSFDVHRGIMAKLGTYKTAVSCLYIKKLSDINLEVLRELCVVSLKESKAYWASKKN